jgi:hypothetical protein
MMGFLKDINKLKKQGEEISKTWDPGAQARDSVEQMRAMNEAMTQATQAMADGVPGTAQVVSVSPATGSFNMNPTMRVDLLVTQGQGGGVPRPVSKDLVVPVIYASRVYPGATLPVMISAGNPDAIAIMWDQAVV